MFRSLLVTAVCFVLILVPVRGGHTLNANHARILAAWLADHRGYHAATDADCECAEDIESTRVTSIGRWGAIPDYHPYIATGDFNGDGVVDFAVAVIDDSKTSDNFTLLIFNGPFTGKLVTVAFVKAGLDLRGQGLFFGPPRPKPYRLVLGRFESEGWILRPYGRTYKMQ